METCRTARKNHSISSNKHMGTVDIWLRVADTELTTHFRTPRLRFTDVVALRLRRCFRTSRELLAVSSAAAPQCSVPQACSSSSSVRDMVGSRIMP